MARKMKTMDGGAAAAHVAYELSDVAAIYPITPSSMMAELTDKWASSGRKNIFGQPVAISEMQSEAGAIGVVHGSLSAGALTTTYTSSQGLLLMIPNMYKIAGELLPCVIHVAARAVSTHALSIFGDHSDVMACRQTGFAMLAATNPQEVMDFSAVAHLSTIKGRIPFLHFFDGFRTSHEMQKVAVLEGSELAGLLDYDALDDFRKRSLNPERPMLRGSAQNPDVFFQVREASNSYYNELPNIVEEYMGKINELTGKDYGLFNYYGAKDADRVIVAMGSVCDTIEEVIDYMNANGEKVGLVKVRLYRPFVTERFLEAIPKTVKKMAVIDRTKEPGCIAEPLCLDVTLAIRNSDRADIQIVGGRYGLASKDTAPSSVFAIYDNLAGEMKNGFTVGIEDDVTHLSLPLTKFIDTTPKSIISCKFWGLGSDGTVGANKNSIKIIGDNTDMNAQAYFDYDSKKSGGVTMSHLRFGKDAIKSTYLITSADFVACHNPSYLDKYEMVEELKDGGSFLLNCQWSVDELDKEMPNHIKKYIADHNISLYIVDGIKLAREIGLAGRINMILQSAFFKISNIIPIEKAVELMKKAVVDTYAKKGEKVVSMNHQAIDAGIDNLIKVDVPSSWKSVSVEVGVPKITGSNPELVDYVQNILMPINSMQGNSLPVSTFIGYADGRAPQGSSAYEKRGIAVDIPSWKSENCIQCNQCAYVCPHAVIRPFAVDGDEKAAAPEGYNTIPMVGKGCEELGFRITVSVKDCTGCGSCARVCPGKKGEKALVMEPLNNHLAEQENFDYSVGTVKAKDLSAAFSPETVKGSQFKQPLLEFSGACAGCGETPYARLITQLFGDRMMIANATGCSSIWGGSYPATPYTVNADGNGPAWGNSLFEDNAEYGLGMLYAVKQMRDGLKIRAEKIALLGGAKADAAKAWIDSMYDSKESGNASKKLIEVLNSDTSNLSDDEKYILNNSEFLVKKSIWIFGGDGWAYDIGFGGLDHVLASGEDINVFVFDTEVYSNTGGQSSKASQLGQVAHFASTGKLTKKKDLAAIAMTYGYVYTAQISMGANYNQTLKALVEAESYRGPSLVISYAPCISHGIKSGMGSAQEVMKKAVESGYWNLFRFDPRLEKDGKNPFMLDSKEPTMEYREFVETETRYTSLKIVSPDDADKIFDIAVKNAKERYKLLQEKAQK